MFSYEKKNAMNKAIDKVMYSNNTCAVNSSCGINITVLFQVGYKYSGLKSDPQCTILILVTRGVEMGQRERHRSGFPRKEYAFNAATH